MATITVSLPEEVLDSLRSPALQEGSSPEEILAKQAQNLHDQARRKLHPDVEAIIGILDPNIDAKAEYRAYLEKKYT